jgi:ribosomal protein S18 acetylase RimI-like enzyme
MKNLANGNVNPLPEHDIHVAGDKEIEQVCNILASAFTNDPLINWVCRRPKTYSALFRFEAEALYKHHGQVYINSEQTGAAMWLPPGVAAKPPLHWRLMIVIWKFVSNGSLDSMKRGELVDKLMSARHPYEPHFYLRSIGASLENQGRGIGSALLEAGLSACDRQGMPAYLESSNEKNNPLYERYGFEVVDEQSLPEGGPTIWFMHREA